ncbi:MAG: hypothetical protein RKE49_00075 [Oceanicaulis sp.]
MALAILTEEPFQATPGARGFRIDIGSNRYFRLAVGGRETRERQGARLLAAPVWTSPMQGPLEPQSLGRARASIPDRVFDRDNRWVQLMSYRTAEREGPAVSSILESAGAMSAPPAPAGFAPAGFAQSASAAGGRDPGHTQAEPRPARHVEAPVSEAMFLQGLMSLLPTVLPDIGRLIGRFTNAGGGDAARAQLANPETIELITQILQAVGQGGTGAAGAGPAAQALSQARAAATARARLSRGQALPALLPLLGTIMPALQQVATPETIQAILSQPTQHMQTIINGMKDFARLGIESHEQDLRHLRELNPGVVDENLHQLLMSMSLGAASGGLEYRRSERVRLHLDAPPVHTLAGRPRSAYRHGAALGFALRVELPERDGRSPRLDPAIVQLEIKCAQTLDVVMSKRFRLGVVDRSGPLAPAPRLTAAESAELQPDKDYLFCFVFAWKTRRGDTVGAPLQHRARLVREVMFDRVEAGGETIALSDPGADRDYWHRLWAGQAREDAKRFEAEIKYLTVLRVDGSDQHARMETRVGERAKDGALHTRELRLKSGMEYAPAALNRLRARLAPGEPDLDAATLEALAGSDLAEIVSQSARAPLSLRGRRGAGLALWAYPVMRLSTIVLRRVAETTPDGAVARLEEVRVRMPLPHAMRFIATGSS